MKASEMTNIQIADYILSLQSDVDGFPFSSNEIIREAAKRLLTDGDDDISKDAEIAELRECLMEAVREKCPFTRMSCKHDEPCDYECGTKKWRKALEGSNNATK